MRSYLEKLPLSMNSKHRVRQGYWRRVKGNDLRLIYSSIKRSEKNGNIFDVKNLKERGLDDIDVLTYSFPCQDLSQQGLQKGLGKNTRSGMLWEIEKALDKTPKSKLPKYLLMENVVPITYKKNSEDLNKWISKLKGLGYRNDIQVLNSADFGSPQSRRRAFMLSVLGEDKKLPKSNNSRSKNINDILLPSMKKDELPKFLKYKITIPTLSKNKVKKSKILNYTSFNSEALLYYPTGRGPTLTATGANSRIKIKINESLIRRMNAEEAIKYMGFDYKDYKNLKRWNILSDNKIIFLAGNSISIEVLTEIMKGIYEQQIN